MAEEISIQIKYGAKMLNIRVDPNSTLQKLREILQAETDILPALQKIMYKGTLNDNEKTLHELKVTNGAKMVLLGAKMENVTAITTALQKAAATQTPEDNSDKPEPEVDPNESKEHEKILSAGPPSDALPPSPKHEAIPPLGIKGIKDKVGTSIRLSFKLDLNQLWIGSSSSTQKIFFPEISDIKTWPIKNHPGYNIACFYLGKNSKYWVYWVPDQYVRAMKGTVLGWTI